MRPTALTAFLGMAALTGITAAAAESQDPCVAPGVLVVTDSEDSGQNTPPVPEVDVKELYIGESVSAAGANQLLFTLKVAPSNAGIPPPQSQWYIVWARQEPDADFDRFYVGMTTDPLAEPSFEYGKFGVALPVGGVPNPHTNTPTPDGAADDGAYDPDTGTITIALALDKADGVAPGDFLAAINVRTYFARPAPMTSPQAIASDISVNGEYDIRGGDSCGDDKSGFLGVGALPAATLAFLLIAGLGTRRVRMCPRG